MSNWLIYGEDIVIPFKREKYLNGFSYMHVKNNPLKTENVFKIANIIRFGLEYGK